MKLKEILKKNKAAVALILICALGAALMLGSGNKKSASDTSNAEYTQQLENKIEQMVSAVCGGKAEVIVTLECGAETEYARDSSCDRDSSGSSSVKEEYVVMSGGEPLALKVIEPKIRGIAVACEGGDSAALQLKIINALSCAYGVPASRIYVVSLG